MTVILLFLPAHGDDPWRWLRVEQGEIATRGEGVPEGTGDPVIAVTPADAVTLHWAALPGRSYAQSIAAARILISEASAGPIEGLHVAVGDEGDTAIGGAGDGDRPIAVVAADRMRGWLDRLAALGIDPVAMVPAPMLLPRPEAGYVRADLGGQSVVRGANTGFADEARLTELIVGDRPLETLDRPSVEAALTVAALRPALDLRQGIFARRKRRAIDWALIRRLALLGGLVLLATLAIDLVRIVKYSVAADAAEMRAETIAREALPRGANQGDADRLLVERLSWLRGPGLGFSGSAAAMADAVRAVPGTELTALSFEPNGDLRLSVAAVGEPQANQLVARLRDAGFVVAASTFQGDGQRVRGDLTVTMP